MNANANAMFHPTPITRHPPGVPTGLPYCILQRNAKYGEQTEEIHVYTQSNDLLVLPSCNSVMQQLELCSGGSNRIGGNVAGQS